MKEYKNNVVILGDGQLGSCIQKMTGWDYISRKKDGIDAKDFPFHKIFKGKYEQVLNCIGCTHTYSEDKQTHWDINYKFVSELADWCDIMSINLIHISTDYIYANSVSSASEEDVPVHCANWYGYTKLLGDAYVQLKCQEYLIVRCSFKPYPFPYPKGFINQIGNFDYTNVIADKIIKLIRGCAQGVYNVGTSTKTIYDLAKQSKPDVEPIEGKIHSTMPTDVTMNCSKFNNF